MDIMNVYIARNNMQVQFVQHVEAGTNSWRSRWRLSNGRRRAGMDRCPRSITGASGTPCWVRFTSSCVKRRWSSCWSYTATRTTPSSIWSRTWTSSTPKRRITCDFYRHEQIQFVWIRKKISPLFRFSVSNRVIQCNIDQCCLTVFTFT